LRPEDVEIAPDIVSESGKEFTDGCGEMALDVVKRVCALPSFEHYKNMPLPSAFQVRSGR